MPVEIFDHAAWDTLLKRCVDDNGMVNYRAWHCSATNRKALQAYLSALSTDATKKTALSRRAQVSYLDYNWNLNAQK